MKAAPGEDPASSAADLPDMENCVGSWSWFGAVVVRFIYVSLVLSLFAVPIALSRSPLVRWALGLIMFGSVVAVIFYPPARAPKTYLPSIVLFGIFTLGLSAVSWVVLPMQRNKLEIRTRASD